MANHLKLHARRRVAPAFVLVALLVIAGSASPDAACADAVTLKNGNTYQGKVVKENDTIVTFDAKIGTAVRRKLFLRSHIVKLEKGDVAAPGNGNKPADKPSHQAGHQAGPNAGKGATDGNAKPPATGPRYFVIPIKGTFGREVKASVLEASLQAAKKTNASAIVLEITSGGGEVNEMLAISQMLLKWQSQEKTPLIAYIKKEAFSAAAITALSVRHIYMAPAGAMGSAMIIEVDAQGSTRALDSTKVGEKFSSAIRAKARTAAEAAGHSPLIVEAMMQLETELSWARDAGGKLVILKGPPSVQRGSFKEGPRLLIEKGRLLSLTSGEAATVGISRGTVKDLAELGAKFGMPGWASAGDAGQKIHQAHVDAMAANIKKYEKSLKMIRLGISKFERAGGNELIKMESAVNATRTMLIRIERMAEEHRYIAERAVADFPQGTDSFKRICDIVLRQIKEAKRARRN